MFVLKIMQILQFQKDTGIFWENGIMDLQLKEIQMEVSLYGFLLEVSTLMEHLMENIFRRNSADETTGIMHSMKLWMVNCLNNLKVSKNMGDFIFLVITFPRVQQENRSR